MQRCSMCTSDFEPREGSLTEWGLVCSECFADYERVPTHYDDDSQAGKIVALNALGIGLAAVTGVGFRYRGRSNEPMPIPERERLRMLKELVAHRVARVGVRRLGPKTPVHLRRGEEMLGAFSVSDLAQMWTEGRIQASDSYWYEGMPGWLPVTQFVPPTK